MPKLTREQKQVMKDRGELRKGYLKEKETINQYKKQFDHIWKDKIERDAKIEIEAITGKDSIPQLRDIQDLYSFFDPIEYFKSEDGEELKVDLTNFKEVEKKYKTALMNLDKKLEKLENDEIEERKANYKKNYDALNTLEYGYKQEDGITEEDIENIRKLKDDLKKQMENDGTIIGDLVIPKDISQFLENEIDKMLTTGTDEEKRAVIKGRLNQLAATYLNRFVPVYTRYPCSCCGTPLRLQDFYVCQDIGCSDRVDQNGNFHMHICKACCQKLLMYYYTCVSGRDIETALKYLCMELNIYWDEELFEKAKEFFEESGRKETLVGAYVGIINRLRQGLTFLHSPFLEKEYINNTKQSNSFDKNNLSQEYNNKDSGKKRKKSFEIEDAPYEWSAEEARNRKDMLKYVGYDPFADCKDDNEKRILFADLAMIVDEDVAQDYVKLQSAITIVKSFNKIRKLENRLTQMELNDAPIADQKAVYDLKTKELAAVSTFSKDSGFAERYKTRQSQGQTSFTGIIKAMDEKKYEDQLINKYDIATSATIQDAADASFKAIFNQMALSDAEVYKIASDQLSELRKLRTENAKLEEDLRIAKYQLAELGIREKARKNGVDIDGD